MEGFADPSDGYFDISEFLASKQGFLPIPILITEPAVGYGAGVAVGYFHDKLTGKEVYEPDMDESKPGRRVPPSMTGAAAAGTENGTRIFGLMHFGVWDNDNIRYTGILGHSKINMQFYGLDGGSGSGSSHPVKFSTKANALLQKILFRAGKSDLFIGTKYIYLGTDTEFDTSFIPIPGLPNINVNENSAGLGLVLEYDSRNSIFTPDQGISAGFEALAYRTAWGSDEEFNKYDMRVLYYTPLTKSFYLGLRGDAKVTDGRAPFYEYPFIDLRGIPVMRYQGEQVLVGEAELRWDVTPRWSAVIFGGAGVTKSPDLGFAESGTVLSKGLGFRYFIARRLGMRIGIDIASGPEDTAFYITVGSAWGRF